MSYLVAALVGAVIAWFGGDFIGVYDGRDPSAHYIGAAVGALAFLLIAFAVKPRPPMSYNGPVL